VHTHVHARTFHARTCEWAGCASVSRMLTLRVPHAGTIWDHMVDRTPGWDPMRGGIISGGTLDAHLQAGSDAVPSGIPDARTQHSRLPTKQTSRLTASSDDCFTCLLPASPVRARAVPSVSTKSSDVGAFSTRCDHAQYPIVVPMPVLRKAHAATQRMYSCGRPKYPMRVR
jgi:hypothetical protein